MDMLAGGMAVGQGTSMSPGGLSYSRTLIQDSPPHCGLSVSRELKVGAVPYRGAQEPTQLNVPHCPFIIGRHRNAQVQGLGKILLLSIGGMAL